MSFVNLKHQAIINESTDQDSAFGISCRSGRGNWEAFIKSGYTISDIFEAANDWKKQIDPVERPWLCWNVNPDWCLVQQKLVQSVGWTPVIGTDPRCPSPRLYGDSIFVDFNRKLGFAMLFPHFILDYVFLFLPRLAFWHSDLLLTPELMKTYATAFDALPDGSMAATQARAGLRDRLTRKNRRFWELLGCTTAGASKENYDLGCGWWLAFYLHPNCPTREERQRRIRLHWEYGAGVRYWSDRYGGRVDVIDEQDIAKGHFSRINNNRYKIISHYGWARNIQKDLPANFDLDECCRKMGLSDFL